MAGNVIQMDYEYVQGVAKGFLAAKAMVTAVANAVWGILEAIKTGTFVGWLMAPKFTAWQQNISNKQKNLEQLLQEYSDDLNAAVADHRKGDARAGRYFTRGIRL
jgi:hypothetical protein